MGIYIKGMDCLPEDGTEFVVKKDEYGTWIKPIGHMGFSMRLIDVPEPHGRLIDASYKVDMPFYDDEYEEYSVRTVTVEELLMMADNEVPTIIEAERSEDDEQIRADH